MTFVGVNLGRLLAVERVIVICFPSTFPHVNVGLALHALIIL